MPVRIIGCYVKMLPVIKAEESLRWYQAMACGAGAKNKKQGQQMRKIVREWIKTMNRYAATQKAKKAANLEEATAMLSAMGIRVVMPGAKHGC